MFNYGEYEGEAILPHTRTELTIEQELLGRVIALAASDCKRVIAEGKGWVMPTVREQVEAASGARFFLSDAGQGMVLACGLGRDGIRQGRMLAGIALERMGLAPADVLADDDAAWASAMDTGLWPRALARTMSHTARRQGTFCFATAA